MCGPWPLMPTSVSFTSPTRRPTAPEPAGEIRTASASGAPAKDESARSGTTISNENGISGPLAAALSMAWAGDPSAAPPPSSAAVNAPSQRPCARTTSSAPGIHPSNIGSTGSVEAETIPGGRISIRTPLGVERRISSVRSSIRIRGETAARAGVGLDLEALTLGSMRLKRTASRGISPGRGSR